jgi:hypothetical protein
VARHLEFVFEGKAFKCAIDKIDRAKLYGSVDVETRDTSGHRCVLVTLASDGRTLIPSGGTAIAYFSADGSWLDRSQLIPVNAQGHRVNAVGSSFDQPIELEIKTTPERFLDHSVRLAYSLTVEGGLPGRLISELQNGAIFKIDFSYRGGINADPAFVMFGSEDVLWLLVGNENDINFVGCEEAVGLADEDSSAEADELDFDMMS